MTPSSERPGDMERMQQEALRRVQEMQSRARTAGGGEHPPEAPGRHGEPKPHGPQERRSSPPAQQHAHPHTQQEPPPPHPPSAPPAPMEPVGGMGPMGGITDIFQSLMKDSDRTLILVLILLLANEETDTGLVLALMYLLI